MKDIYWYIRRGDISNVSNILLNSDTVFSNKNGMTPLHFSVMYNKVEITELLLKFGVDPNLQNNNCWTPLHYACKNGNEMAVNMLLEYGADINALTENKCSPLHFAVREDNLKIVSLLLNKGADPFLKEIKTNENILSMLKDHRKKYNKNRIIYLYKLLDKSGISYILKINIIKYIVGYSVIEIIDFLN